MNEYFWIGFMVLGGYLAVSIVAYLLQDYFFFHPERLHKSFKFKFDHAFEEVQLTGVDNSVIDGLYFPVDNTQRVVFYFKGNTRSIKGWSKFAKDFTSKGYSFFMIDYPGFGKSTGKRDEKTILANAQIAYDWLAKKYDESDIIIYGRSLGAGFAGCIAKENDPRMLILDSPFFSFSRLANYYTRILPIKWIIKYSIPLNEYLESINCPVFIIHGNRDITIPYKHSKWLQAIDPTRIKLYTITGGRHNNLPKKEQYHNVLDEILNNEELYTKYCNS